MRTSFVSGKKLRQTKAAASNQSISFTVTAAAAERPLWFPGSTAPEWLDGSLPGDYGFDPLGLGSDPELLKWMVQVCLKCVFNHTHILSAIAGMVQVCLKELFKYRYILSIIAGMVQAELQNGRWAMLGAAGIFIPEFLTSAGILNTPSWFTAGKYEYFADAPTLFAVQLALMGWAEGRRWADIVRPGSVKLVTTPSDMRPKMLTVIHWAGLKTMMYTIAYHQPLL